jgi:hypothetical protein
MVLSRLPPPASRAHRLPPTPRSRRLPPATSCPPPAAHLPLPHLLLPAACCTSPRHHPLPLPPLPPWARGHGASSSRWGRAARRVALGARRPPCRAGATPPTVSRWGRAARRVSCWVRAARRVALGARHPSCRAGCAPPDVSRWVRAARRVGLWRGREGGGGEGVGAHALALRRRRPPCCSSYRHALPPALWALGCVGIPGLSSSRCPSNALKGRVGAGACTRRAILALRARRPTLPQGHGRGRGRMRVRVGARSGRVEWAGGCVRS